MRVCVQGLWHLGSVVAACLASRDIDVVGFDYDEGRIAALARGEPPLFEPGLEELIKHGLATGRLRFTHCADDDAVKQAEFLWISYDTPVDDDDNANVEFVVGEIEKTLAHLGQGTMVLVSSQLPVGSVRRLDALAKARYPEKQLTFACTPENLRLGKAIQIFLDPDRIVVGVRTAADRKKLANLLHHITDRIEWMSIESAEMTKHAINAFLAVSVTFANEIASICETVGADAKEVERGLKSESRIGPKAYLSPGGAFSGGTLARDIAFLGTVAAAERLSTPLLASVKASNDEHKTWVRRGLMRRFGSLRLRPTAVWGLTYKPGTDTLRRSLAVELCDWLIEQGSQLRVHDPAVRCLPERWAGKATHCADPIAAIAGADALVVATEWPEYRLIDASAVAAANPKLVIFDPNRHLRDFSPIFAERYIAVGSPWHGEGRR